MGGGLTRVTIWDGFSSAQVGVDGARRGSCRPGGDGTKGAGGLVSRFPSAGLIWRELSVWDLTLRTPSVRRGGCPRRSNRDGTGVGVVPEQQGSVLEDRVFGSENELSERIGGMSQVVRAVTT